MMKKILSIFSAFWLAAACAFPGMAVAQEKKISVVATIFPIYDWVREIIGGSSAPVELTLLLDSGVDLHSYQPTVQDIIKVSNCDLFLYVGGESDEWAADVLEQAANPRRAAVSLIQAMGDEIKAEETVEGMEAENDAHDGDEEEEADEHVWLSLRNAGKLVAVIADALGQADPENAAAYQNNAAAYQEKLAALDRQYAEMAENAAYHTLLFGDRFPFRYLTDDYDLRYYAAFSGCSAETEASFQTIAFLAQKTDELHLPAVLTIEGTHHKIAETIVSATQSRDQKILVLDSLQGVTAGQAEAGVTYLSVMENNLSVLREALN